MPLLLFFLILLTLTLSILFGNAIQRWTSPRSEGMEEPVRTEGFIQFRSDLENGNIATIPYYSGTNAIHKLHDTIYYDSRNGCVVVLDGEQFVHSPDMTGNTISNVTTYDRNGTNLGSTNVSSPPASSYQSTASAIPSLVSSYKTFYVVASTNNGEDKYEMIYIPWGLETFIHIIELKVQSATVNRHKHTYYFNSKGELVKTADDNFAVSYKTPNSNIKSLARQVPQVDNNNNAYTLINNYSTTAKLFQLSTKLHYDPANGNMVEMVDSPSQLNIYSRISSGQTTPNITPVSSGTTASAQPTTIAEITRFAAGVFDTNNDPAFTILYISVGKRTVMASLYMTGKQDLDIRNVARFKETGTLDTGSTSSYSGIGPDPTSFAGGDSTSFAGGDHTTDPNKQFLDLLMFLQGTTAGAPYPFANDYMLKTQIVPPVCPSCPACPNTGVCTNCGGNGGSGTKGVESDGKRDENGNLLYSAGSGATSLVRDAGTGATSLVRDAATGAAGLAKDTVGGAVGLAKETVGGAVGLAKETVGGALDIAEDAGSGVLNAFGKINPTVVSDPNIGSSGSGSYRPSGPAGYSGPSLSSRGGADPLSYYGAVPSKGNSDFIPITADFSKFGR